jgi:hypothetical protein
MRFQRASNERVPPAYNRKASNRAECVPLTASLCDGNGGVSGNSAMYSVIQNRGFSRIVANVLPTWASPFCIFLTVHLRPGRHRSHLTFRPQARWEDVQRVLDGYILPVSHTIKRSPHSTSTKWADHRASSLPNNSQNFRAAPTVSYPNGTHPSSSIMLTAQQFRDTSFSDSKRISGDPHRSPHRGCAAATKTLSEAVPPTSSN